MKKRIVIIGGGSSALALGCRLNTEVFEVIICEKNSAPGRKFLVAGDGGLNLTHSENEDQFIKRYTPSEFLEEAFRYFSNKDFVKWLNDLGIQTYTGTSGRIFPVKGLKPAEVLKKILDRIKLNNVSLLTNYEWKDFANDGLSFQTKNGQEILKGDLVVFCLGGASWPVTGSAGDWISFFREKQITVNEFSPSNCKFLVDWPGHFITSAQGKALKNIVVFCGDKRNAGEVVLTADGIEGSGIYPLSPQIRSQLALQGVAEIKFDLKPSVNKETIFSRIHSIKEKKNFSEELKRVLNLDSTTLQLIKNHTSKEEFSDPLFLSETIKNLSVKIKGTGPVSEAISTVGGIALEEIDKNFQLKKIPDHFVIGEMLDYDAPTGGYLLQSCFSMGHYLANYLNQRFNR